MLPKKTQKRLSRASVCFNKSKPNKIVDFSIPFLFPYVVRSDNNPQAKILYNSIPQAHNKTLQLMPLKKQQKRDPVVLSVSVEDKIITDTEVQESKNVQDVDEAIPIFKNQNHVQQNLKKKVRRNRRRFVNKNENKPQQQTINVKPSIQNKPDNFRHTKRTTNPINNLMENRPFLDNSQIFSAPKSIPPKFRVIVNSQSKLIRRNTSSDKMFTQQYYQQIEQPQSLIVSRKFRNSDFASVKSQFREVKANLISSINKVEKAEASSQSIQSDSIDNSSSQLMHEKNLSGFSKRNNTSIRNGGLMFRSSVIKSPSRNPSGMFNSSQSSHLNLIHEENFGTLTVIKEDGQQGENGLMKENHRSSRRSILRSKNKVTISNNPSRLSRTSKMKNGKAIYKKNGLKFAGLTGKENGYESPTISAKNIIITQRRGQLSKSRKNINFSKSIKSIRSTKSNKSRHRLTSQDSKFTSQESIQPAPTDVSDPILKNAVYRYLNHLISKNNLHYDSSQFNSEESIPSLSNIDVSRKRFELKAKLNEDLRMVKMLQNLNRYGYAYPDDESKYKPMYEALERNDNNDQLMLERSQEFGLETKMLWMLRNVEKNANKLKQKNPKDKVQVNK